MRYLWFIGLWLSSSLAWAGVCGDNQVCRLHIALTGSLPQTGELRILEDLLASSGMDAVARKVAATRPEFQTLILKQWAEPWADLHGETGSGLNETVLTLIKAVMDENFDVRRLLWDDILAVGKGEPIVGMVDKIRLSNGATITKYSELSNMHYIELEKNALYAKDGVVNWVSQESYAPKRINGSAGILSTTGFGKAAYEAGTNRRAVPMILREGLCTTMDQMRDISLAEDFILRDVAVVDPDGSVTTFKTLCKGCHAFLDPLATAFVYYDALATAFPTVTYTRAEPIPSRNKLMKVVTSTAYIPSNDTWRANLSTAALVHLGWDKAPKSGVGLKSLGQALSATTAFSRCQVRKAFAAVCGREARKVDESFLGTIERSFVDGGYRLKNVFLEAAQHCAVIGDGV